MLGFRIEAGVKIAIKARPDARGGRGAGVVINLQEVTEPINPVAVTGDGRDHDRRTPAKPAVIPFVRLRQSGYRRTLNRAAIMVILRMNA